jgi:metal-sulfur cluster biosynthetic enzyme
VTAAASASATAAVTSPAEQVEARIWEGLRHVEDPEIPISILGMGLIVSVQYRPVERAAALQITYTAMGCPATDFIEDDIREALMADPDIDAVEIEVVWDPVWTKDRIRSEARETMRRLGIVV